MRPSVRWMVGAPLLAIVAAACGAGENPAAAGWQAAYDTVGDTIVVRTVAGRVWGEPGEYRNSDGGLAVLPDGRVLLRDPRNARINVYSPDGEPVGSWPIRGGSFTSQRLFVDTAGYAATWVTLELDRPFGERRSGLARLAPDGTPADTILAPVYDYEPPRLRAERGEGNNRSISIRSVPFTPRAEWALSPFGYAVGGLSTRYAIDLFRKGEPVLRIERAYEPVAVQPAEKADEERRATAGLRMTDPNWKWDGPAIPDSKPPFRDLFVGQDGRIWVVVHRPGEEVEAVEEEPTPDRRRVPPARWREPVVFDVFEPDGRYLGEVRAPEGFSLHPEPYFRGDRVWAVVRDEDDVQYVTRFRIERSPDKIVRERDQPGERP